MTEDAEAGLPVVEDLDRLEALVRERPGLYLRYSRGPEADRDRPSRDYESGLPLPGLSVTVLSPERWWTRPLRDWLARQVCKYTHLAEADDRRRGWVLEGREVGRGPDSEPLVGDVRPVAWLGERAVAQAREHYRRVFAAGRDSTG